MTDPQPAQRTVTAALLDAAPDLLAAVACAVAWIAPRAPGFDLLRWAAPLYFVELPLALLVCVAGVRRMDRGQLTRREKLAFVVVPTLVLLVASTALLGAPGAVAVLWLGTATLVSLLREAPEASPAVHGLWIAYDRRERSLSYLERRPTPRAGLVVVRAGHAQVMAAVTFGTWLMIPVAFAVLPALGTGGATPEYAAAVGWTETVPGRVFAAHLCLAAGAVLFTVRALAQFEDVGARPPPCVEDDALLQDVIEKVEGRRPARGRGRRR